MTTGESTSMGIYTRPPVDLLYLFLGLAGLLVGAEVAVSGSLGLAKRWGWPTWVAGAILLALGTSLPEFFVALASAPQQPALALGAVFGSNAINVGGVLGLMLVFQTSKGIPIREASPLTLMALMLGSVVAFAVFSAEVVPAWGAAALLGLFVVVLASSVLFRGSDDEGLDDSDAKASNLWLLLGQAAGGFTLLAFASDWFLTGALALADMMNWGAGFAGFVIAAAGTSAPELFTSLQAVRKGVAGAVFGNILGSNAFNLLLVGGTIAFLAEAPLDPEALRAQLWVNLGACAVLVLPMLIRRKEGRRTKTGVLGGITLLGAYLVAAWWIKQSSGSPV